MGELVNKIILICFLILFITYFDELHSLLKLSGEIFSGGMSEFIKKDVEPGPLYKTYDEFIRTVNSKEVKNAPPKKRKEAVDRALKKAVESISANASLKGKSGDRKDLTIAIEEAIGEMMETVALNSKKDVSIEKREAMIDKALKKALTKIAIVSAIYKDDIFKSVLRSIADTTVDTLYEGVPDKAYTGK